MTAVLIDASGYIYRSFYSQPVLVTADGTHVGAVHGYLGMLWRIRRKFNDGSHFAICFDKGKSASRVAIYPEYKGNRSPQPPELTSQLDMLRDATVAMGMPVVQQDGVEADDLMASYATAFAELGDDCIIVSADKDLMQLMSEGVQLYDPLKGRMVEREDVVTKLGVGPELVVDAQALIGDSVDNVPGVPKIGPKTAGKLLAEYGSLDNIVAHRMSIKSAAVRDSLMYHWESALLSRRLVQLERNIPLPVPIKNIEAREVTAKPLIAYCQRYEMTSLAAEIADFYGVTA